MVQIMNTQQYAKEIYYKYSKSKTASQQRIRKMINDGKDLPQVVKIDKIGKNGNYHLLHVSIDNNVAN